MSQEKHPVPCRPWSSTLSVSPEVTVVVTEINPLLLRLRNRCP